MFNKTFFYKLVLLSSLVFIVLPAYSETILAQGNADDLPAIVHASLFNDSAVILFTSDLPEGAIAPSGDNVLSLSKIDGFVFAGSEPKDIAVDLASELNMVVQDFKSRLTVKLPKFAKDTYEVFLDAERIILPEGISLLTKINGTDMNAIDYMYISHNSRKFFRLGECNLNDATPDVLTFETKDFEGKPSRDSVRMLKIIFVKKDRLKIYEDAVYKRLSTSGVSFCSLSKIKNGSFAYFTGRGDVKLKLFMYLKISPLVFKELNKEKVKKTSLLRIGKNEFTLADFNGADSLLQGSIYQKLIEKSVPLKIESQRANFNILDNDYFEAKWILIDPINGEEKEEQTDNPVIIFRKLAPTKCLLRVSGAKMPFWIIFNEGFHSKWLLLEPSKIDKSRSQNSINNLVRAYPNFNAKEAIHSVEFDLSDAAYIFQNQIKARHFLVNGFANGWYIDPKETGSNFDLVIFFLPQGYFYLGIIITIATIIISGFVVLMSGILRRLNFRRR